MMVSGRRTNIQADVWRCGGDVVMRVGVLRCVDEVGEMSGL